MRTIKNLTAIAAVVALMIGFTSNATAQNGKSMKQAYGTTISFCQGELIQTTGNMNVVAVKQEADENGCMNVQMHMNTQGVKGVGMITGNEYKIVDILNAKEYSVLSCDECIAEFEVATTWKVMTKDGQSYTSQGSYHILIDTCNFEIIEVRAHFNKNGGCD